jgi:hypothetical protein
VRATFAAAGSSRSRGGIGFFGGIAEAATAARSSKAIGSRGHAAAPVWRPLLA